MSTIYKFHCNQKGLFLNMNYLNLIRWQNTLFMMSVLVMVFIIPSGELSMDQIFYVVGVGLIFAGGNIINDYYDLRVDILNEKLNPIALIGRRRSFLLYIFFNVISLFLTSGLETKMLFAGAIFSLWFYSFYLQKTPFLGNIMTALLTAVSIYWTTYFGIELLRAVLFSVMCGVLQLIRELTKDLEDIKGDAQEGYKTLPVILGPHKTKIALYVLSSLFLVWLTYVDWVTTAGKHIWPIYAVIYLLLVFMVKLKRAYHQSHYEMLPKILKMAMGFGVFALFFF